MHLLNFVLTPNSTFLIECTAELEPEINFFPFKHIDLIFE